MLVILPLLMYTQRMIYVIAILWLFTAGVGYYNAHFRWHLNNMVKWMDKQHLILEDHPDYKQEAFQLYNETIPQVKMWVQESEGFIIPIIVVQVFNTMLLFVTLVGGESYWMNVFAATGNAALFVSARVLRKRRYTAEGMCRGVQVLVNAVEIQKSDETLDEQS